MEGLGLAYLGAGLGAGLALQRQQLRVQLVSLKLLRISVPP